MAMASQFVSWVREWRGVSDLLCCVAVTAPALADFSYFETLEGFFVEIIAFRIVSQGIFWVSLRGGRCGVVGIWVVQVERHDGLVRWTWSGREAIDVDDKEMKVRWTDNIKSFCIHD